MITVSTWTMQHYVWIRKKPGNGFFVLCGQDSNYPQQDILR